MSDTGNELTPSAVVRAAAGEFLAGHPERAGALVREQNGDERTVDLTQTALVASGQVLQIVQEAASDELVEALLASIGRLNAPRPELRALVVETVRRFGEPNFALLCRRAAHRLLGAAGDLALDAPMDTVLALAAMVTQFDNNTDMIRLACARADQLILISEAPFRLVWGQVAGDTDAQRQWLRMLAETGDPADLLVWYFGLVHGLNGRTESGDGNPALDALAADVAAGNLDTAAAIAKGFAAKLEPAHLIGYAAQHLTRAVIAEAERRDVPAGTVLDDLWERATTA
ncbi:hypothetical protein [Actinoplanes derwentensis]|uniref:Uncharacterized protein n=1 Tax=Actinoplanes derwentensis TaxID=113562 RepID=A0A1H1WU92_9ACTN|nr:hypothetical protein [Actinoplanes derwentensis]GID86992.1 hypothetical protein Ade03nite_59160 [Actinoplanes derwentensis]SDS99906.1 hypothetical protein SAMN04489716_2215 [Actinoplanes derwentensis]